VLNTLIRQQAAAAAAERQAREEAAARGEPAPKRKNPLEPAPLQGRRARRAGAVPHARTRAAGGQPTPSTW
jgi:hypothetical protein